MSLNSPRESIEQLRKGCSIDWNKNYSEIAEQSKQDEAHTFAHSLRIDHLDVKELNIISDTELQLPGSFKVMDDRFIVRTGTGFVEIATYQVGAYKYPNSFSSINEAAGHFGLPLAGRFTMHERETFEAAYGFSKVWAITATELQLFDYDYFYLCLSRCKDFERDLIETFGLKKGDKVLDYGCGTAWFPYLMADAGIESHGFDLFPVEYYPPFVREKAHLFQADGVNLGDIGKYDLVFIRGLTLEYHERNFNDARWIKLLQGLKNLLSDKGAIYWVMYNNVSRVRAFDDVAKNIFRIATIDVLDIT